MVFDKIVSSGLSGPAVAPRSGAMTAIGLMSGTSMDGIDVALIKSDGLQVLERGPSLSVAYRPDFRRRLASALECATSIRLRRERPGDLAELEGELTRLHADAVFQFAKQFEIDLSSIDVVGFHGQTVLHRPLQRLTVQIGDGVMLANRLAVPVVYDMRAADMEAGGEGAPLAPAYHAALAASLGQKNVVAFVNIGGISNITWVGKDGTVLAFDTGPGNALIDQWVEMKAGIPFDQGGAIASEGRVIRSIVDDYLQAPFFADEKRRSLDRNDFRPPDPARASLEDGARTLARLTAESIFKSSAQLPVAVDQWIICGGGRHNRTIMDDLRELAALHNGEVLAAEDLGFDGDSMEAEAWAFLAIRSRLGLPLSWPGTTGCRQPTSGGRCVEPTPDSRDCP